MNIILLTENDCLGGKCYRLADYRKDHICQILRSCEGDMLAVGLINGPPGTGLIINISDDIILECEFEEEPARPKRSIDVICALPRPQTLKKVLATAGCMAVNNIHFIRANRVEKSYFHSPMLQPENYQKYLLEGMAQGKNTLMPKVKFHHYFKRFFEDNLNSVNDGRRLLADLDGQKKLNQMAIDKKVVLAIGPEGGWVPFEIDFMQEFGFEVFLLGKWNLRVENALIASLAQLELC